jgi:subtilase family serine protease
MTLRDLVRYGVVISLITFLAGEGSAAQAQRSDNNVPPSIRFSGDLGLADPSAEINITVHLKLKDKAAFDQAVDDLYDPASPTFHKWMTNADLRPMR